MMATPQLGSQKRNRLWVAGVAFTAACLLAACQGDPATQAEEQIFRWGAASHPTSLDPRQAASFDVPYLSETYESLIKRTAAGELEPGLATEWSLDPSGLVLDLTLREGVEFQDGEPFDAEAVKANIEAAQATQTTVSGQLSIVESTEAVDETHVRLNLNEPGAALINALAGEAGMMISPAALDSPDLERAPVGTGPFELTSYTDAGLEWRAWDGYWNADAIKIDGIEMPFYLDEDTRLNAVISGEVQAAPGRAAQAPEAEAAGLEVTSGAIASIYGVLMNTSSGPLSNPAVRQAIMSAINREDINQSMFDGGCPAVVQPFPEGHWANVTGLEDSEAGAFNPDRAKALLRQAGLTDLAFEMFVGEAEIFQNAVQIIQAQLKDVGIDMKITIMENTALVAARRNGEYESSFAYLQSGRPDASQFIADYYMPAGTFNVGEFSVPGVDALFKESTSSADETSRAEPTHAIIEKVLNAGPPVIPVCAPHTFLYHSSEVSGLEVPILYDYDFSGIELN